MDDDFTAGDRLRQAREAIGVSRRQLAVKTKRALSTIRAHENGQNAVSPAAAADYAVEIGVSAAWLLYGHDAGITKSDVSEFSPYRVPVLGWVIERYAQTGNEPALPLSHINVELPGRRSGVLSAYLEGSFFSRSNYVSIVFIEKRDVTTPLRLSDEVVLEQKNPKHHFFERAVWRVGFEEGWSMFYQGESREKAVAITRHRDLDGDLAPDFLGVVCARMQVQRQED